jgi:hypothetical protein
VDDEVLARATALVGVVDARVHEGVLDLLPVDRDRAMVGVLLDDREQVREQPPLGGGQLGTPDRGALPTRVDAVDGNMRLDGDRTRVGDDCTCVPAALFALGR